MFIKFYDFTEQIRIHLDEAIDDMCKGLSGEKQDEIIESYFSELKEKNYTFYTYLIGMMFSDHYKLLKDSEKHDELDEEDKLFLDIYDDFHDIDDVLNYVDEYPNALSAFLYNMSDFNSYDYFEKRNIWLSCKDDLEFLQRISPLNILDYLYYCQKYNIDMLKSIYDDYTSADKSLIDSFGTIRDTLNELGIADADNYYEVASDLLTLYYVVATDEINNTNDNGQKDKLIRMIKKLENEDYREILSYMDDDKFLDEILKVVFANKNRQLSQDFKNDDIYNDTVRKLKHIKNYFK